MLRMLTLTDIHDSLTQGIRSSIDSVKNDDILTSKINQEYRSCKFSSEIRDSKGRCLYHMSSYI